MVESTTDQRTSREIEHANSVREMFSGIASRYDLVNHVISVNFDKRWRRKVSESMKDILKNADSLVLDVACGTGDLSLELRTYGQAKIIGVDFCRPMLCIAKDKTKEMGETVSYFEGDGLNLSFADESVDAVTTGFGLRNFANWEDGLTEFHRVLKKDGKLAILEFSSPIIPGFRQLFAFYFSHILPRIGDAVSGSWGTYEYLPNSVSKFPDQTNLAAMMRQIGFSDVKYKNLAGGVVAIHTGTK